MTAIAVVANVLGAVTAVCLTALMLPVIIENHQHRSTEGLSLLLVVLWHLSALLVTAYVINKGEAVALIVTWILNAASFAVVEAQFVMYSSSVDSTESDTAADGSMAEATPIASKDGASSFRLLASAGSLVLSLGLSIFLVVGLLLLFNDTKSTEWVAPCIGSVAPSILLGLGFLPQVSPIR